MHRNHLVLCTSIVALLAVGLGVLVDAPRAQPVEAQVQETYIHFVRHAEDETGLVPASDDSRAFLRDCSPYLDDGETSECCSEVLSALGEYRAARLAEWFLEAGITTRLTEVIASHKVRTRQTVAAIAADAGLDGDVDLDPGDGVQQIPPFASECDRGFESSGASRVPMIDYLFAAPAGSEILVGAHSGTIYRIMDALGVDTSDPEDFPRRADGRVNGFGNVWTIRLSSDGAELVDHVVLDLDLLEQ